MQTKPWIWPSAAALALLTLGMYWAGLHGGFFFDDGPSILHAPGVRMTQLSWEALQQAWHSGGAGPTGRPVAQLSFALNYLLSSYSAFAFKLTNLLVHGLCAALIYHLTVRLLRAGPGTDASKPMESRATMIALTAASIWLLHPIQLLPVLHVVQRMTSLAALFLLLAFWLHVVAREQGGRWGAAGLVVAWGVIWPLAVLSKETALLFPVFVLLWEVLLRRPRVGHLDRYARIYLILASMVALVLAGYLLSDRAKWLWTGYEFRPFNLAQRLWTEARVIWIYLGLILFPQLSAFAVYHDDIAISTDSLTPWTTLPSVAGLAMLIVAITVLRRRLPLTAFGLAWFLAGHLMESTLLPLELAHEHRNYLPLLGVVLAIAGLVPLQAGQTAKRNAVLIALGAVVLTGLAVITAVRAFHFGDPLRRALTEVQHHPASASAQLTAGQSLADLTEATKAKSPTYVAARSHLERAAQLDPDLKLGLLDLLELDCKAGLPTNHATLRELDRRLRRTLFAPADQSVLYYLKELAVRGGICLGRAEVERLFDAAIANPGAKPHVKAILYSWRADYLWLRERDLIAAKDALAQSLALNPGHPSNRLKWAQLLWLGGDRTGARAVLEDLRESVLSSEERRTIKELLAEGNIGGS